MAELRWVHKNHRPWVDPNDPFAAHDELEDVWTSANYNSVEEALLQAAHDHLLDASIRREVHDGGELVHDGKSIAAAAKKLDKARETNGFRPHFDAASELKAIG